MTASDGSHSQQTITASNGTITDMPDGTQNWKGSVSQAGSYTMQWDLLLDPDPSVSGSIALTNASAGTQTFTLNVSLPINPANQPPAGSATFGSSAISISDANGDSTATLGAQTGSAIYTAYINANVTQKQLFTAPYSKLVSQPGGVAVDSQSFPPPVTATTALATSLGIQHSFTLTAGDSATMNSTFTITVPEPCSLVLAGLGALGLVAVRARRSK